MTPEIVDIIAIAIAVVFLVIGWKQGFVRIAGGMLGIVASIVVALYGVQWIETTFGVSSAIVGVIAFIVLVLLASKIVSLVVAGLDIVRRVFSLLPLVGLLNSTLGALVGGLQASALFLAVAFVFISYVPQSQTRTTILSSQTMQTSADILVALGLGR